MPVPLSAVRRGSAVDGVGPERVAVVDDHRLVAETMAALLTHLDFAAGVVAGSTLGELGDALLDDDPDAVVLDFHLGELGAATPLIRLLVDHDVPVVVLTADPDPLTKASCLEAGANAVLTKGTDPETLIEAVAGAVAGVPLVADDERHALLSTLRRERTQRRRINERFDRLTPRESDVLRLVCDGLSAAEIADTSYVSLATVRSQIRSVLAKLGVNSQLAAVAEAHRTGWVGRPGRDSSILATTDIA